MKMCSIVLATAASVAICVAASPVLASPVVAFADNFEADTVGSQPTNPAWSINASGSNLPAPTANVVSTTSSQGSATKALSIVNTAGNYLLVSQSFTTVTAGNGNTVSAQMEIRINSEPSSGQGEDYRLSLAGDDIATYVRFRARNASQAPGLSYYSSSTVNTDLLSDLRPGDWYLLSMAADLSTQKYSVSVQNLTEPSQASASASGIAFYHAATHLTSMYFTHVQSASNFDATIDNVRIDSPAAPVPEPATLSALAIGGLLMLRRGHV